MKGSNGSFWHWWVLGLAISSVAACFSSPNIHSVDFALFKSLGNQHQPFRLVFGLYTCPTTILYSKFCLPFRLPLPTLCEHLWHYLARPTSQIFYFVWWELQWAALVLGRFSNTVKRSTFCVSFICMLTILGWL